MQTINFYKNNLSDFVINKEYYKFRKWIIVIYFIVSMNSLIIIDLIFSSKFHELKGTTFDIYFSISLALLFLFMIPQVQGLKNKISHIKVNIIYEFCRMYNIPFTSRYLSNFKDVKKDILKQYMINQGFDNHEMYNLILEKLRHEIIVKKTNKNNKNYVILLFGSVTLTFFFNSIINETTNILAKAQSNFLYEMHFTIFAVIFVGIVILLMLMTNFGANQILDTVNDIVNEKEFSFYQELETILYELIEDNLVSFTKIPQSYELV